MRLYLEEESEGLFGFGLNHLRCLLCLLCGLRSGLFYRLSEQFSAQVYCRKFMITLAEIVSHTASALNWGCRLKLMAVVAFYLPYVSKKSVYILL